MHLMQRAQFLFAAWCLACRSAPAPTPPHGPLDRLAALVPADVTAITRLDDMGGAVMAEMFERRDEDPCWVTYQKVIVQTYLLSSPQHDDIIVLEGLPEGACATQTFRRRTTHDEASVVRRDGFLMIGPAPALAAVTSRRTWAARLAILPRGESASASIEPLTARLFDIPSEGYDLVIDAYNPVQHGRIIVHAYSVADAAAIATRTKAADLHWPSPPSAKVIAWMHALRVTVSGRDVAIELVASMFKGLDREDRDELGDAFDGRKAQREQREARQRDELAGEVRSNEDRAARLATDIAELEKQIGEVGAKVTVAAAAVTRAKTDGDRERATDALHALEDRDAGLKSKLGDMKQEAAIVQQWLHTSPECRANPLARGC